MRFPLPPRASRHRRDGFSLLELIVAVGIIAALTMILLGAISGVREKSNDVECIARMRQLVLAIRSFQAEHQGRLPPVRLDGSGVTPDNVWTHRIYPYLTIPEGTEAQITKAKAKFLTCPAEKNRTGGAPVTLFWQSHYGVNGSGDRTFHFDGRLQRPRIDNHSETMMLIETSGVRGVRARSSSITSIVYRHGATANVAYFDGRIAKIRLEQIPANGGDPFWLEW